MLNKTITIVSLIVMLIMLATGWFFYTTIPKTAYVNTMQLYSEFGLKKELEVKYNQTENARKAILDSLQRNLMALSDQQEAGKTPGKAVRERFAVSEQNFVTVQHRFEEDNLLLREKYNEEIWSRINQYVKEYGERNGYTYIYGANGEGNLMYASKGCDITDVVKEYINKRYQGDLK